MNISQLKVAIAASVASHIPGFTLPLLQLNTQVDKDDETKTTDWVSHWDDTNRVRISMPREVMAKVIADKEFAGLAFKKPEIVPAHGDVAQYLRVTIITPTSIEATF